ncbi:MAG: 2OG-Fe(II) oxygenase family protein [Pacificimonas sp.]|jgi:Rps23 Pro-64 3,4-dihydroxylase Tpa1-like proline 4-hydroxylase|nr:2OG-Fe(II) oxygenase family protein [Pacificimonas sp.]
MSHGDIVGHAFRLAGGLTPEPFAAAYRARGRVQIADFLHAGDAEALYDALRASQRWRLVFNDGDRVYELDRETQAGLPDGKMEQLALAAYRGARAGFQYRYEAIRVPDGAAMRAASGTSLDDFAAFLSGGDAADFLKAVTGDAHIRFADAQATAFGLNHFLTAHHDEVSGKQRSAAYAMSLTPGWRPDFGGILMFHDENGQIEEGYTPRFNALNLLAIPQPHSVSIVTPFAPSRRYSVTGWLRTSEQPA